MEGFYVGGRCAACHVYVLDLVERGRLALCAECARKYDELKEAEA